MKKLFLTLAIAATTLVANAQENYWWVGAQGGASVSINPEYDGYKKFAPTGAVSVGYRHGNDGVRLNVNTLGFKQKTETIDGQVLSYMHYNLDYMPRITGLFTKKEDTPLNLYGIVGLGWYTFKEKYDFYGEKIDEHKGDLNFRVGLQLDYRIARHWSVNAEAALNASSIVSGLIGINYRFGMPKVAKVAKAPKVVEEPVVDNSAAEEAARRAAAEEAARKAAAEAARKAAAEAAAKKKAEPVTTAVVKKAPESIEKCVFFTIGQSDPGQDAELIAATEWIKNHPSAKVTVTGYADKGTGSAEINHRVAAARATKVANALKAKGIAADRITVDSKGDTVQPFAENDKNRVVIIVAAE